MTEETTQPVVTNAQTAGRRGITWTPRMVIWTVILVAILIFVLQNLDETSVNLLFWDYRPPLAVVVLIAALAGYILGWLRPHFRPRRRP
jgi:uncharacterized integral membrane protein